MDELERVRELGERRRVARAMLRETSEQLPAAIRAALDMGQSKIEIAKAAGISRVTLDQMLRDTRSRGRG